MSQKQRKKRKSKYEIDNAEFSKAIIEYVRQCHAEEVKESSSLTVNGNKHTLGEHNFQVGDVVCQRQPHNVVVYADVIDITNNQLSLGNIQAQNNKDVTATPEFVSGEIYTKKPDDEIVYPRVSNYIGASFLTLSEKMTYLPNYIRYTFKEEMIGDGYEDCLRRIRNFSPDVKTASGKPNAFSYFYTIVTFAFLRRIEKEKKHQESIQRYLNEGAIENMIAQSNYADPEGNGQLIQNYIDELRNKNDEYKEFRNSSQSATIGYKRTTQAPKNGKRRKDNV